MGICNGKSLILVMEKGGVTKLNHIIRYNRNNQIYHVYLSYHRCDI